MLIGDAGLYVWLILVAVVAYRFFSRGPDDATRHQVEVALRAKGLILVDLGKTLTPAGPSRLSVAYVASARNPFGNIQRKVFSRDPSLWSTGKAEQLASARSRFTKGHAGSERV